MWDCEQFLGADDDDDTFADVDQPDEYYHSQDSNHSEEEHSGSLGTIKGTQYFLSRLIIALLAVHAFV